MRKIIGTTDGSLALLISTVADPSRAARLHALECNMVNTAKQNGRPLRMVSIVELEEMVADLNEREFPVKRCKCCRKELRS